MPRSIPAKPAKSGCHKSSRNLPKKIDLEYRKAIEKLQLSEGLLRASERKYRSLVESIPDIIFALDLDGSIGYVGPRWKKILGHEEDEVLGKYFIDLIPEEEHTLMIQVFKEVRNRKKSVENIQVQFREKKGPVRFFSASAAPLVDEQGKVVGTMGIARDVTERENSKNNSCKPKKWNP